MADLYTNYDTSVALRDAGAPQDASQRKPRWCPVNRRHGHVEVMMSNYPHCERAFRADEIIEALKPSGSMELEFLDDGVVVWLWNRSCVSGPSLVEALAQAWIVVLKEEKR